MQAVTITQITPTELENIIEGSLRKILGSTIQQPKQEQPNQWLNIDDLCQYIPDKPSKATVYGWVHENKIPVHKGGKKLRFLRSEIDTWLKQGRKKTLAELASEADTYFKTKNGGKE